MGAAVWFLGDSLPLLANGWVRGAVLIVLASSALFVCRGRGLAGWRSRFAFGALVGAGLMPLVFAITPSLDIPLPSGLGVTGVVHSEPEPIEADRTEPAPVGQRAMVQEGHPIAAEHEDSPIVMVAVPEGEALVVAVPDEAAQVEVIEASPLVVEPAVNAAPEASRVDDLRARAMDALGRFDPASAVVMLWMVGVVFLMCRQALGMAFLREMDRNARNATATMSRCATAAFQDLGLRRPVRVRLSDDAAVPMTWGWRRAVVLLPTSSVSWDDARLRSVLLHEGAHIRRGDWAWFVVAHAACALQWFNPLAWVLLRVIRNEREFAADAAAVSSGVLASRYAEDLLAVAREAGCRRLRLAPAFAMGQRTNLEGRLMSILESNGGPSRRARGIAMVAAGVLCLGGAAAASVNPAQPDRDERLELREQQREAREEARLERELERIRRAAEREVELEQRTRDIEEAPTRTHRRLSKLLAEYAELMEPVRAEEEFLEALELEMEPFEERVEALEEIAEEHEIHLEPFEDRVMDLESELAEHEDRLAEAMDEHWGGHEERIDGELGELERALRTTEREIRRAERRGDEEDAIDRLRDAQAELMQRVEEIVEAERLLAEEMEHVGGELEREYAMRVREIHAEIQAQHLGMRGVHAELREIHEQIRAEHEGVREIHEEMRDVHERLEALYEAMEPLHEQIGSELDEIRRQELVEAIEEADLDDERGVLEAIDSIESLEGMGEFTQFADDWFAVLIEPEWSMPVVLEAVRNAEREGELDLSSSSRVDLYAAVAGWAESTRVMKFGAAD